LFEVGFVVWARTKMVIFDDIWEDITDMFIKYSGPSPERYYKKLLESMETVFSIPKSDIQEIDYTWEKTNGELRFAVWWRLIKAMDIYSYIRVDVKLDGQSREGSGYASITIKPALITEYPQDTLIQQSIFYEMARLFWHQVFYHKKRMEFMKLGRELVDNFNKELKRFGEELRGEFAVEARSK